VPTLTIDGKPVTVPEGTTVIQAAEKLGIFIPRYCYHPGLSVAGNCRICLVEVAKSPKLQIACNTPAAEGMVVLTRGAKVNEGREAVLEFLLVNHPLDCPVCDQSGECDLQNFYMTYGLYNPRFKEQKVKKAKAVPIGPTVMLDAERCILCSRCVRFTDEVTKTGEFGIMNRGDRSQIGLYPGKTLDNKYSGNVVDICPVGALTDRDFRFKARVWYLSTAPSVCGGCSRGCSIDLHYVLDRPHLAQGDRVMRLKPRWNPEVNQWWMCDEGRYGYKFIDQKRLTRVTHRGLESSWEEALAALADWLTRAREEGRLDQVGVIPSPGLTTEELFLIREFFREALGIKNCLLDLPPKTGCSDGFLIQADKSPNGAAVKLLGLSADDGAGDGLSILQKALAGQLKALWVFGHDLVEHLGEEKTAQLAKQLELFVYQGSNENPTTRHAHWVLPGAVYVEKDGTFVNCQGRVQRVGKAFGPPAGARPEAEFLAELAGRLEIPVQGKTPEALFAWLAREVPAFAGMTYEKLGWQGMRLPQPVRPELVEGRTDHGSTGSP
jgi:NADH-quinone oxidoreductase subunit G